MKVLFISRSYPPVRGGIENQNFFLSESLRSLTDITIIANKRGRWYFAIFYIVVIIRSIGNPSGYDVVLLGDGVLAPVGRIIKLFYASKKIFCIVHGLDVTFGWGKGPIRALYRSVVFSSLKRLDSIIAVSSSTKKILDEADIRIYSFVIPNGIPDTYFSSKYSRRDLEQEVGRDLANKWILFLPGRYVQRKGALWFMSNVLKKLPNDYMLICAGARPLHILGDRDEYRACSQYVTNNHLQGRVLLYADVSPMKLQLFYNTADICVVPNVPVESSVEGFGIAALEAASCAKVVLASNLEGIPDAVHHMKNGILIPPENAGAWAQAITRLATDKMSMKEFGEAARRYTLLHFSWKSCAEQYLKLIMRQGNLVHPSQGPV